ncbi:NFIL3 protein, partial [Amia calva]|nr:NFIL3 protein [Amia calva]
MPGPSLLSRRLLGLCGSKRQLSLGTRRKREFTPDEKKDASYWDKRRKNNEAAKRSREKRRINDFVLESRLLALSEENARLRAELLALQYRFGLLREPTLPPAMPTPSPHNLPPFQPSFWSLKPDRASFIGGTEELWLPGRDVEGAPLSDPPTSSSSVTAGEHSPGCCTSAEENPPSPPPPRTHRGGSAHPTRRVDRLRASSPVGPRGRGQAQTGGSKTAETKAYYHVSSSKDSPRALDSSSSSSPSSSKRQFPTPSLPVPTRPSTPPHSSPYATQAWLLPSLSHTAVRSNLLLPWGSQHLSPTPLLTKLPLYLPLGDPELRRLPPALHYGDTLSLQPQEQVQSKINMLSAEVAQLKRYIGTEHS